MLVIRLSTVPARACRSTPTPRMTGGCMAAPCHRRQVGAATARLCCAPATSSRRTPVVRADPRSCLHACMHGCKTVCAHQSGSGNHHPALFLLHLRSHAQARIRQHAGTHPPTHAGTQTPTHAGSHTPTLRHTYANMKTHIRQHAGACSYYYHDVRAAHTGLLGKPGESQTIREQLFTKIEFRPRYACSLCNCCGPGCIPSSALSQALCSHIKYGPIPSRRLSPWEVKRLCDSNFTGWVSRGNQVAFKARMPEK